MRLPEGYEPVEIAGTVLLARQNGGQWATWKIRGNTVTEGHFFCKNCPGAESLARADFEKRAVEA